jgi:transposase
MAKVGKRYFTTEFKREAVALWEMSGRTQAEVTGELGIMPTMLGRWHRGIGVGAAKTAAQPCTSIMSSPADQASEVAELRRELNRTRMERDILKN